MSADVNRKARVQWALLIHKTGAAAYPWRDAIPICRKVPSSSFRLPRLLRKVAESLFFTALCSEMRWRPPAPERNWPCRRCAAEPAG